MFTKTIICFLSIYLSFPPQLPGYVQRADASRVDGFAPGSAQAAAVGEEMAARRTGCEKHYEKQRRFSGLDGVPGEYDEDVRDTSLILIIGIVTLAVTIFGASYAVYAHMADWSDPSVGEPQAIRRNTADLGAAEGREVAFRLSATKGDVQSATWDGKFACVTNPDCEYSLEGGCIFENLDEDNKYQCICAGAYIVFNDVDTMILTTWPATDGSTDPEDYDNTDSMDIMVHGTFREKAKYVGRGELVLFEFYKYSDKWIWERELPSDDWLEVSVTFSP